jgi:hypothetical protein
VKLSKGHQDLRIVISKIESITKSLQNTNTVESGFVPFTDLHAEVSHSGAHIHCMQPTTNSCPKILDLQEIELRTKRRLTQAHGGIQVLIYKQGS